MLKEMRIGKLYRYIPTRNIAALVRIEREERGRGYVYKLVYLSDPVYREFNLHMKDFHELALWEEVGTNWNWDCYNGSLAYE